MRDKPYTLIAELTYRCPLRCPYCSNPTDLRTHARELPTDAWLRIFQEAAELGVLQVHLSGGEPLARRDLGSLAEGARRHGLYVNLVTSGVPLTRERLLDLREQGVAHVQISVQGADPATVAEVAGVDCFEQKLQAMRWVKELGLQLTMNVVLQRRNIEQLPAILELASSVQADRLELANVQYLGWALLNRAALLPTRDQLVRAHALACEARERWRGRMELIFVAPDYYATRPRACMDGWARRFIHVTPDGTVLPCHAAASIPGLSFVRAGEAPLSWIWSSSSAFQAFRGEQWMKAPCRSCPERTRDFGGCRCQALALTGDARAADPACALSPQHELIKIRRREATAQTSLLPFRYRTFTPPE